MGSREEKYSEVMEMLDEDGEYLSLLVNQLGVKESGYKTYIRGRKVDTTVTWIPIGLKDELDFLEAEKYLWKAYQEGKLS